MTIKNAAKHVSVKAQISATKRNEHSNGLGWIFTEKNCTVWIISYICRVIKGVYFDANELKTNLIILLTN